jgi:hypothetical protein
LFQHLVAYHAKKNHKTHHREVERRRDAEKIDEILEHLKQRHADQNPDYRSFAAAQAATPSMAAVPYRSKIAVKDGESVGQNAKMMAHCKRSRMT